MAFLPGVRTVAEQRQLNAGKDKVMSVNKSQLTKSIQDRGQYATVPNELWTLPLSIKAKTAFCFLIAQSEKWNPGLRGIAAGISMSVSTAKRAIEELESANMIQVESSPNGLRNVYTFTSINDWTVPSVAQAVPSATAHRATPETVAVSPVARIQEEYNTNPIPTNKKSSKVRKDSFLKEEKNSTPELPPYKVKASPWYQHYLKSSYIEQQFNSFPESLKLQAIAITDKEDFLAFVNENTPPTFQYVDPIGLLLASLPS